MRPLTQKYREKIAKTYNLDSDQTKILKEISSLIVKEYFKLYLWIRFLEKYSTLKSINLIRRIEFEYQLQSVLFQIYYGIR